MKIHIFIIGGQLEDNYLLKSKKKGWTPLS